jgi:hypothetical protein
MYKLYEQLTSLSLQSVVQEVAQKLRSICKKGQLDQEQYKHNRTISRTQIKYLVIWRSLESFQTSIPLYKRKQQYMNHLMQHTT